MIGRIPPRLTQMLQRSHVTFRHKPVSRGYVERVIFPFPIFSVASNRSYHPSCFYDLSGSSGGSAYGALPIGGLAGGHSGDGGNGGGKKKGVDDVGGRFRMSDNYEEHSGSQLSIGSRIIHDLLPKVVRSQFEGRRDSRQQGLSILDIACGPGVLTTEIFRFLMKNSDDIIPASSIIHVDGLDIDPVILARATSRAQQDNLNIKYHVADFRQPPSSLQGMYDVVFSNEGLHWTGPPPISIKSLDSIFYRHLEDAARKQYAIWAASQWHDAMLGIAQLLRPDGYALLQFGSEGQLDALYTLMNKILSTPHFLRYKTAIWFPLYYPRTEELQHLVKSSGMEIVSLHHWTEPLTEQIPEAVTQFVRGWTEPYFVAAMEREDVGKFYDMLQNALSADGNYWVCQTQWHRTVVIAKKNAT